MEVYVDSPSDVFMLKLGIYEAKFRIYEVPLHLILDYSMIKI